MFEYIRTHKNLALGFLLLLVIPSFVFFGIEGYTRFNEGSAAPVATVAGANITRGEWDQTHQRQVERVRRQNPGLDVRQLDTPEMRRETLDGLLRDRVLLQAAQDQQLAPSVARMARLFDADPQFAGLRGPDGRISRDLLASQGMTPEMFDQRLRQDLASQQVLRGVVGTVIAPPPVVAAALDPLLQRRAVQVQRFEPAAYRARVQPTDAEIEAHHKAHASAYQAPEFARIEYVVLDLDTLTRQVSVPEEDLRRYYAENASRYTVAEERRASHILFAADKAMPAEARKKVREQAEQVLAELRKAPGSFAALAKKHSADPGSAERGGDLDFFGRGAMVKPFEDAVFAMKPGEISGLIETEFGFHIITVAAVRGGDKKPFEAVRGEIEAEVRKSLAQRRWAESAEQFTNLVYEQSDSLQPVLDRLRLQKQTATVQRTPAPGASGALASERLLQAVFGNDALRNKRNTDAVEVGPNQLASARVVEYQPARTLPLAEVRERVRDDLIAKRAAALAREEGQARLAALRQAGDKPGEQADALPQSLTVSRPQPQGLPKPVLDAVMGVDASKLPAVLGVDLGEQGYVLARVVQVLPREPLPGGDEMLRRQYAQVWAAAEAEAYTAALRKRYKAEIKPEAAAAAASAPLR